MADFLDDSGFLLIVGKTSNETHFRVAVVVRVYTLEWTMEPGCRWGFRVLDLHIREGAWRLAPRWGSCE